VRERMAHGPTCTCRLCIEQYGPIKPPRPGLAWIRRVAELRALEREARRG
jgi:hypothetical protein